MNNSFTHQYSISKTLSFELRPIGRTEETVRSIFLPQDEKRAKDYFEVKELLDAEHKAFLNHALQNVPNLDWEDLENAHEAYRKSEKSAKDKKVLEEVQGKFRKEIARAFKADGERYAEITATTPSRIFARLIEQHENANEKIPDSLLSFVNFGGYFIWFQNNRKNIYSEEAQSTSAANRAINENFPRFLHDVKTFLHLVENYPSIIKDAENELLELLNGETFACLFDVSSYGRFLPQDGIDLFNQILGGYTKNDGTKIRGLNEFVNLYRQQHKEVQNDKGLLPLIPFYKQILSDRTTLSNRIKPFENDSEVIEILKYMLTDGLAFETESGRIKIGDALKKLFACISNSEGIWIDRRQLSNLSKMMFDSWGTIKTIMESEAVKMFSNEKTEKKKQSAIDKWMRRNAYSLHELFGMKIETDNEERFVDVAAFFQSDALMKHLKSIEEAKAKALVALSVENAENIPLREQEETKQKIQSALDSILELFQFIKPLYVDNSMERDESFYSQFDKIYSALDEFVPFFNKIRNYLTKKHDGSEPIRLMFGNPTLAAGWDKNKELDNTCVLFIKDGLYYLGIMNPKAKTDFSKFAVGDSQDCYQKMVYKFLPEPHKMLPKVFFSEKGKSIYNPPPSLIKKYQLGFHRHGETFDLEFCHELIDFFKKSIGAKTEWQTFNFKFSPTESYDGIDKFYNEIKEQGYKISFENIPVKVIDSLVDDGKLCLFKLWHRDFSDKFTGKPDPYTFYWKAAFSPENLRDYIIKLNGNARVFYRPASIKKPFSHKTGENMLNRRGKSGKAIPGEIYGELFRHFNGDKTPLSAEAQHWIDSGELTIKKATYEIVKDRRFTKDQFKLEVPIVINFKQPESPNNFNEKVNQYLRENTDVNIIGLDRGERNLIYLTVVNQNGDILEQRSLNSIGNTNPNGTEILTNYKEKLSDIEKERQQQRKSWQSLSAIADLKSGYISMVVHEIAKLMIKYNAIVVLEDLNVGFKQTRTKVERQVYQNFEIALIKKLNYLCFKDKKALEVGGVLAGLQLANKFETFEKVGKQTGFIFYVPAGYTSKIDPTTGFTNLFNTKKCTNAQATQRFFNSFDSIIWDEKSKSFALAFDYNNFKTGIKSPRSKWVVYSAIRRLVFSKEKKSTVELNPTQIIIDAVKKMGLALTDGFDLKAVLSNLEPSRENAWFFRSVFYAFDKTLHLRNSNEIEDYIESPVLNAAGEHFDSRNAPKSLPQDADANGAYHIALKGIMLINSIRSSEKPNLAIKNEDWFKFAQELAERKIGGIAK